MPIYSSLDIDSVYNGNSGRVITEKDFFKELCEFGGGAILTDSQVDTYAERLFDDTVSIAGFPGIENSDATYNKDRCLTHFKLTNGNPYWTYMKSTGRAPYITATSVYDFTSPQPFSTKSIDQGQTVASLSGLVLTDKEAIGPFQKQIAYYNYLYNNVKLELTTTDGGIPEAQFNHLSVKINSFRVVDTLNNNRLLCSSSNGNILNGYYLGVYSRNVYFNNDDIVNLRYMFAASANTGTTKTYRFYGEQKLKYTIITNGVESEHTYKLFSKNIDSLSISATSATSLTFGTLGVNTLPVKVSLMLNVVRNIKWINIDLTHLVGATVKGFKVDEDSTVEGVTLTEDDLDLNGYWVGDNTHRVVGFRSSGDPSYTTLRLIKDSSSVDTKFEVWDDALIARIDSSLLSQNTIGYRPGLQLSSGMWLCCEAYNIDDGPPTTNGDWTSSWAVIKDDHVNGYDTTLYFSPVRLRLFHNITIQNKMHTPIEINGTYINAASTIYMSLALGDFVITVYNNYREEFRAVMYLDKMGPSRIELELTDSDYYVQRIFNTKSEFGMRGGMSFIVERK